jgi:hypothetical protein
LVNTSRNFIPLMVGERKSHGLLLLLLPYCVPGVGAGRAAGSHIQAVRLTAVNKLSVISEDSEICLTTVNKSSSISVRLSKQSTIYF